jgi:uncharacterized protein YoxC
MNITENFKELNQTMQTLQTQLQNLVKQSNEELKDADLATTIYSSAKLGTVNSKYLELASAFMDYAGFLDHLMSKPTESQEPTQSE